VAALTLHVAAMALWVGGLFTVAVLLADRGADRAACADRAGDAVVGAAVARFSRLALAAVGTLAATGVYQAWREAGGIRALTGTAYGRLLLAKVALLLVVLLVARRSRGIVARRPAGGAAALRRGVVAELAGAAVLLVLAVLLAGNAPARDAAEAQRGSPLSSAPPCCGSVTSVSGHR
jgi:copper transport protein